MRYQPVHNLSALYRPVLIRLAAVLLLFIAPSVGAVYFPGGIDWTNPSQSRFVQSLYLNVLGRAPAASESQSTVQTLRRNDNRTARLRVFESLIQTTEYQRTFNQTDNSWQIFQAPDYNYKNGNGFYRYQASRNQPTGFTRLPGSNKLYAPDVAKSIAHYYDAFCYRGEPCIDNPELARDRNTNAQATFVNAHACAAPTNIDSQFKWVAVNGTTYPQGIGRETICLEDGYLKANQLTLERYDCNDGYTNCRRNRTLDLKASRSGPDNDGHPSFFFRDGSRLALIQTDVRDRTRDNNTVTRQPQPADPLLTDPLLTDKGDRSAHACADPSQTTSRFNWKNGTRTAESKGVGTTTICMDNYYYAVRRMTLARYNCSRGFTNCHADPANNLIADRLTRANGNPTLVFSNGSTVTLIDRGPAHSNRAPATRAPTTRAPATTTDRNSQRTPSTRQTPRASNTQRPQNQRPQTNSSRSSQLTGGSDCADSKKRLSQFRWKSNGLSSWPDGIDGRFICLNDSYYEVTRNSLQHYSCQRNYTGCTANPSKNIAVRAVSQDGAVWTLGNGDEVTLITR